MVDNFYLKEKFHHPIIEEIKSLATIIGGIALIGGFLEDYTSSHDYICLDDKGGANIVIFSLLILMFSAVSGVLYLSIYYVSVVFSHEYENVLIQVIFCLVSGIIAVCAIISAMTMIISVNVVGDYYIFIIDNIISSKYTYILSTIIFIPIFFISLSNILKGFLRRSL